MSGSDVTEANVVGETPAARARWPSDLEPHRTTAETRPARDHVLYVCTGCNYTKAPEERVGQRGGNALYFAILAEAARRGGVAVHVEPVACLSVCKDTCALALTAPGKYTYTFGWVAPTEDAARDVVRVTEQYALSPTGHIDRSNRPQAVRRLISKVPPIGFDPNVDDDSCSARMAEQVPKPPRPW